MGSDMVVALGRATLDGHTIFAQNSSRPANKGQSLCLTPGRLFAAGEKLRTQQLEIAQARQVYAVLGSKPSGSWGYASGINENRVAAGCITLPAALTCPRPGLLGTDLVRLMLERSSSARQAVDLLTGLVKEFGQGAYPDCPAEFEHDSAFLIADPLEAYAVETAGSHWVYQEIHEVRAVSSVRVVHQDWDRISPGLAAYAIERGWWPEDGSKLDFATVLSSDRKLHVASMRRWGRATMMLQEQNGHIDAGFLRRLLCGHAEEANENFPFVDASGDSDSICQHPRGSGSRATAASFIAELNPDAAAAAHAWCAFGVPCASVYFPVFLDGELPDAFVQDEMESIGAGFGGRLARLVQQQERGPGRLARMRESLARLQICFDQETEEFLAEACALKRRGALTELQRQASMFMQHNLEKFEEVYEDAMRMRAEVAVGN